MPGKFSDLFDREYSQRQEPRPRLSSRQQAILQWLRQEARRRPQSASGVPYPTLVAALDAEKVLITNDVRSLLKKGLVAVTLPPGAWVRYVALTDKGAGQVRSLSEDERKLRRRRS